MHTFSTCLLALAPFSLALVLGAACGDETSNAASGASGAGAGNVGGGDVGGAGGGGMTPTSKTNHDCAPAEGGPANLKLTSIGNFAAPVMVTFAWGDSSQIYVVSLLGEISAVDQAGNATSFLDLSNIVEVSGEGGLLGLAFHPDYADNGRFFVHYTELSNPLRSVIEEYRRDPNNPNVADPVPVQRLLEVEQPASNHDGGHIEFSPDEELLYIAFGDGGGANDQFDNGQNKQSLLAALLRVDVSTTPYTIPAGNITDGLPEIFHYGLRNPYRFSFDHCDSNIYIGDVGQNEWEEIDVAPVGDGPINWGWSCMEGNSSFNAGSCIPNETLRPPTVEYPHSGGSCGGSVTGGVVYRGSAIPWLRGAYFYGDFCTGDVWLMRYDGSVTENSEISGDLSPQGELGPQAITGFGNDNDGNVYFVSINGPVYRLDAE